MISQSDTSKVSNTLLPSSPSINSNIPSSPIGLPLTYKDVKVKRPITKVHETSVN